MSATASSLEQLESEFLRCYFASRPFEARLLGLELAYGTLPLLEDEQVDDLRRRLREVRRASARLSQDGLSDEQRLTCRLIDEIGSHEIAALRAMPQRYVVSPLPEAGLTSQLLVLLPNASLGDSAAVEDFRATCAAIPELLEQSAAALDRGRASGQTPVRHLVVRAIGQIEDYLALPPAEDPYCRAAVAACGVEMANDIGVLVAERIRPAFRSYAELLRERVRPSARPSDHAGLAWIADGEEHYAAAVRRWTTLDLTPADVHAIGLGLVEQLRPELARVGAEAGLPGDFAGVCARLRGDPRLYYDDAGQLLARARHVLARAEAVVPRWIVEPPTIRCEVREMDALESSNGVLSKYQTAPLDGSRPAIYWLNTSGVARRPVYETAVLTHHESVPGHHLESTKTLEVTALSSLRRLLRVLPFYEGWCLYMEGFADELGLYEEAVSRLGMLSFALWRSCRLVVDTGLHQFGWSRGRAIRYLWENTALTRNNVANEVDRYIAHPGSAVGYMTGCLAIREIRRRLGVNCSDSAASKAFHTNLLRRGQLTIGSLAEAMGLDSPLELRPVLT